MNTQQPRVTVLMPVYNGERYLGEAIESILGQTFGDFEFLIINDGSNDRSVEIIESYDDPRIHLVHNERNMKLVATLNRGLDIARGEYIARMDCDDISLPERLEKQIEFMDSHPDVGVLGTGFQIIDEDSGRLGAPILYPSEHGVLKWSLFFYSPLIHPSVMMRKGLVLAAGGYTSEVIRGREKYSGEDYDLWRRLSGSTRFYNLQGILLRLRKHDENITRTYLTEHLKNTAVINHAMISECLGEDVSHGYVRALMGQRAESVEEAVELGNLIYRLYGVYVAEGGLSVNEIKLVRRDAAGRLLNVSLPYFRDIYTWKNILLSFFLYPRLMAESAWGLARRIIRGMIL